jgi:Spy/CpxP family protein refolding chaperone
MKWLSLMSLAGLLLLFPINSYADQLASNQSTVLNQIAQVSAPNPDEETPPKKHRDFKWLSSLNLTGEQKEEIKTIKQQAQEDRDNLEPELKAAKEKMRSLFDGNATIDELRVQHQQLESLEQQARNQRFETMLQIREVLTPEQRTKLAELRQEHKEQGHHQMPHP